MVAQRNPQSFEYSLLVKGHVLRKSNLAFLRKFADPASFKKKHSNNLHRKILGNDEKMIVKVSQGWEEATKYWHKDACVPSLHSKDVLLQTTFAKPFTPCSMLLNNSTPFEPSTFLRPRFLNKPAVAYRYGILHPRSLKTQEEKEKLSWYRKGYRYPFWKKFPTKGIRNSIENDSEA